MPDTAGRRDNYSTSELYFVELNSISWTIDLLACVAHEDSETLALSGSLR